MLRIAFYGVRAYTEPIGIWPTSVVCVGKSASILAFEEDDQWVPRLQEFNDCTGATVRLTYLPEGEDGMEDAIRRDVGDDTWPGEGIFDAYIVQAPWYVCYR
jgi:hypothetical protein